MFFGAGRKNVSRQLADGRVVLNNYGYFHLMFVFRTAFGYRYKLATQSKDGWAYKDISEEEARQLLGGEDLKPHWWWRYGLYVLLASFAVMIIVSIIMTQSNQVMPGY